MPHMIRISHIWSAWNHLRTIFCTFLHDPLANIGEFNSSSSWCRVCRCLPLAFSPGLISIGFWPDLGWTGSSGFRVVPMDGKVTTETSGRCSIQIIPSSFSDMSGISQRKRKTSKEHGESRRVTESERCTSFPIKIIEPHWTTLNMVEWCWFAMLERTTCKIPGLRSGGWEDVWCGRFGLPRSSSHHVERWGA